MGNLVLKRKSFRKPQVGDMRNRIVIAERDIKSPAFGSAKATHVYTTIATVWSSLSTLAGKTIFTNVEIQDQTAYLFIIRYGTAISALLEAKMTNSVVVYSGKNYKIQQVENPEERNWNLFIYCTELGLASLEANQ